MPVLFDEVGVAKTRRTQDGYLVADVRVARSGIMEYAGFEVDPDGSLGLRDREVVRVYRPEDEVFADTSLQTDAYRPVTDDHPSTFVDAETWPDVSVGSTGGEVAPDGEWVRVPMLLMDADAIHTVVKGKRQLSMGYTCTVDAVSGTTPTGETYDAVQSELRMNHLAVVTAARAGPKARIGDQERSEEMPEEM